MPQLDLTRTKAALDAYDEKWGDEYDPSQDCPLAKAVGDAYGLDIRDWNNTGDCAHLVQPGPRTPLPGTEASFVRFMVAAHCKED